MLRGTFIGGELKVTSAAKNDKLEYEEEAVYEEEQEEVGALSSKYGPEVTGIDASAVKQALKLTIAGNVEEVKAGQGADAITVNDLENLTLSLGSGNDKVYLTKSEGNRNIKIKDVESGTNAIYVDAADFKASNLTVQSGDAKLTMVNTVVTFTTAANAMINIYDVNNTGTAKKPKYNLLYSQSPTVSLGTDKSVAITAGKFKATDVYLYSDEMKTVTTDSRRGAMNLIAEGAALESVQASGKADLIDVKGSTSVENTIATGAGNDTVVIHAGHNYYLSDFTTGTSPKKADSIVIADEEGVEARIVDKGVDEEGNLILGFAKGGTGADSDTAGAYVTIAKGEWNGAAGTKAGKSVIIANIGTDAYSNPTVSYQTVSKNATVDAADIELAEEQSAIDFSNNAGGAVLKGTYHDREVELRGTKGNDTLLGATYTTAVTVPEKLNGGAGNDLLVGNIAGGELIGGAGNDTLKTGAQNAAVVASWTEEYGDTTLTGGAGNDTFIITGESNVEISDYSNPTKGDNVVGDSKASLKAAQKVGGNDKLVLSYDKKATGMENQVYLQSSDYEVENLGNGTASETTYSLSLNISGDVLAGMGATYTTRSYADKEVVIKGLHEGDYLNAQIEGISYSQQFTTAQAVTLTKGNYNAFLSPNVVALQGSASGGVLVGNVKTMYIAGGEKKDTLISNRGYYDGESAVEYTTLAGGGGADVYDVTSGNASINAGNEAKELSPADGLKKAKIKVSDLTNIIYLNAGEGNLAVTDGNHIALIAGGVGSNLTFYSESEESKYTPNSDQSKAGKWTTSKTTQTLTRLFSTNASDSVLSGGSSTYLKVSSSYDYDNNEFVDNFDDIVTEVKAGNKSKTLYIDGRNVAKVTGAGTAEEMMVYGNLESGKQTTVATGKGNDTLAGYNIYVTDFTAASLQTKDDKNGKYQKGDYKAGDILYLATNTYIDDEYPDEEIPGYYFGTDGLVTENVHFDRSDVEIAGITLKNMKNKTIAYIDGAEHSDREAADIKTIKLVNQSEYEAGLTNEELKAAEVKKGAVVDMATVEGTEKYTVLDTTKNAKGADINTGKYVQQVYAGKAVDTIVAGLGGAYDADNAEGTLKISGGAGADFIVFNKSTYTTYTPTVSYEITDYAGDKLVLNGAEITGVSMVDDNGGTYYDSTVSGKGNKKYLTAYSDVTVNLSDGNVIYLDKVAVRTSKKGAEPSFGSGDVVSFKLTRAQEAGSRESFNLDYATENATIANGDGSNFFDLRGAAAKVITVDTKLATTIEGGNLTSSNSQLGTIAANHATGASVGGITYKGAGSSGKAITFEGSAKNDEYIGGGAADVVNFTQGGNNSVSGGGRATVTLGTGKGNDFILVKDGDDFTVTNYYNTSKNAGGLDKIVLDTLFGGGRVEDVSFTGDDLVLSFTGGYESTYASATTYTTVSAKVTLKNYAANQQVVNIGRNVIANNKLVTETISQLKFGTSGTGSSEEVTIAGSSGNDTLSFSGLGVNYIGASAGTDVYKVDGSGTIDGFKTSDILLSGDGSSISIKNYSNDYLYLGGEDATVYVSDGESVNEVVLKGVGKTNGESTNAIKVSTAKKNNTVTLFNQQDVKLSSSQKSGSFDLNEWGSDGKGLTKSFNASAAGKGVDLVVEANENLESYTSGKGNDTLITSEGEDAKQLKYKYTAQDKAKADSIYVRQVSVKAEGTDSGEDTNSNLRAMTEEETVSALDVDLGSNKVSRLVTQSNGNALKATIVTNRNAAAGTLNVIDDSDGGGLFTYSVTFTTTSSAGIVGNDYEAHNLKQSQSDTALYTFTATQYVESVFGTHATGAKVTSAPITAEELRNEFWWSTEVDAMRGESFGAAREYTLDATVNFGATRRLSQVKTGAVTKSATVHVVGQDVSLDGMTGYTVDGITIGSGDDEYTIEGNQVYYKITDGEIEFSAEAQEGYDVYTFGADGIDGLYYNLNEITTTDGLVPTSLNGSPHFETTTHLTTASFTNLGTNSDYTGSVTAVQDDTYTTTYTLTLADGTHTVVLNEQDEIVSVDDNTTDLDEDKAGFQFEVTTDAGAAEEITVALNDQEVEASWTKDISFVEFKPCEEYSLYYAMTFGTDNFGNSNSELDTTKAWFTANIDFTADNLAELVNGGENEWVGNATIKGGKASVHRLRSLATNTDGYIYFDQTVKNEDGTYKGIVVDDRDTFSANANIGDSTSYEGHSVTFQYGTDVYGKLESIESMTFDGEEVEIDIETGKFTVNVNGVDVDYTYKSAPTQGTIAPTVTWTWTNSEGRVTYHDGLTSTWGLGEGTLIRNRDTEEEFMERFEVEKLYDDFVVGDGEVSSVIEPNYEVASQSSDDELIVSSTFDCPKVAKGTYSFGKEISRKRTADS